MVWGFLGRSRLMPPMGESSQTGRAADRAVRDVDQLEKNVESLTLACQAMWELIRDRTSLKEDDLTAKMEEIDLRDGVKDGRISPIGVMCTECGRKTSRRRESCLYCGHKSHEGRTFGGS